MVNYDPDDDEHAAKNKNKNGYYGSPAGDSGENNNAPICRQPGVSSKIHEDDLRREIQTNVPMLAPEVMAIFANSQIFQSNAPPKQQSSKATSPASVKFAISDSGSPIEVTPVATTGSGDGQRSINEEAASTEDGGAGGRELSSDKLLQRLEGTSSGSVSDERDSRVVVIPAIVEEEDTSDEQSKESEVVLRPPRNFSELSLSKSIPNNKTISLLQAELPYFSIRPASENDIFTISSGAGGGGGSGGSGGAGGAGGIPAISYSNLPKNYLETPVIEKYRESVSLYSIQTAGINRQSQTDDLSMPRYYGKSDLFVSGIDRANSRSADAVEMGRSDDGSLSLSSSSLAKGRSRNVERSKRLMNLRTALPPLNLGLVRGSSASNLRDRREERESRDRETKSAKIKDGLRV
uniref:Uncharacterized protein n=1 Tax=Anopheles stephensi TaxID=30069 RepID=A0A182YM77_ANOST